MKRNTVLLGLLAFLLAFALVLSGCGDIIGLLGDDGENNKNNNNTDSSGGKPATLSNSASLSEAAAKLDQIIAYCEANPNTTNSAAKIWATSYKTTLSYYDSSSWGSYGPSAITLINTYIDQLVAGNGSNGSDNGTGTGDGTGTSDDLIVWFEGTPGSQGVTEPISADLLVQFASQVSGWDEFVKAGGELYVNNNRVYSGSTMIYPTDQIRVLAPHDGGASDEDKPITVYPIDPGTGRPIFFEGRPADYGFPGSYASNLVTSTGQVKDWNEFTMAGCELYVNSQRIVDGTMWIGPTDYVKVLGPYGYNGEAGYSGPSSDPEPYPPYGYGEDGYSGSAGGTSVW